MTLPPAPQPEPELPPSFEVAQAALKALADNVVYDGDSDDVLDIELCLADAESRLSSLAEENARMVSDKELATVVVTRLLRQFAPGVEPFVDLTNLVWQLDNALVGLSGLRQDKERLQQEWDAVGRFSGKVLDVARTCLGCDVDGGDVQKWAVETGLLEERAMTSPCGEDCACAEMTEEMSAFPVWCYFPSSLGEAVLRAARSSPPPEAGGPND